MGTSPLAGLLGSAARSLELEWAGEEQRELEMTQAERYARDPLAWLNSGQVWIASPFALPETEIPSTVEQWFAFKRRVRPMRMRLFPDQERTVAAWIDLEHLQRTGELGFRNLADEKSRQIGETWVFAGVICWALHYHRVTGLAMHQDGGEIDDGGSRNTVKSLFGKVRYIDQRLDRAKVPGLGQLAFRPFSRELAKIENLDNGAVVYGEGQTDDPGRGGTYDFAFVDEAAFVMHGEKVYAALDEACPNGKALNSTVNGDGNFHARIADERPAGYTYLRLHWSAHPIYGRGAHVAGEHPDTCPLCAGNAAKVPWSAQHATRAHRFPGRLTSPWYDWRVAGKTDEQVANELDIDRARALGGRVYREFQDDRHVILEGIGYDAQLHLELAADYGLDATSVLFLQDHPEELRLIGIVEMGDLFGTTATPERVAEELRRYMVEVLDVEARFATAEWTRKLYAVGDPAGHARSTETGKPWINAYRRQGFFFRKPPTRLTRSVETTINAAKRVLLGTPKPLAVCGVKAPVFAEHMRNNVWPTDALGSRRIGTSAPLDNVHNHSCRAFAYYTTAKFPPPLIEHAPAGPDEDEPGDPLGPLERRRRRHGGVLGDRDAVAADVLPFGSTL